MTLGQQRAVRELERLRATRDGCFGFGPYKIAEGGFLVTTVSIRLGLMETRAGGLEFLERESFVLCVPPGFPFDQPTLVVSHKRFAFFPHVSWSYCICLYQTTLEWNPADGLYGFFDRLNLWLGKAAINDMDPVEGPLEPPYHIPDISRATFVIRANAPVPPGTSWLGLAELDKRENRIEVVGWRNTFADWPDGRGIALAIVLPSAIPMEFPRNGGGLFVELEKQGVDQAGILHKLSVAALLTPPGAPVYFIIGLPMRRAADGTPRLHIAVWSADAEAAQSLRDTIGEASDTDQVRELRQKLADAIYEVFKETAISWCRVMEDRPEIVTRRDAGSSFAWFLGKRALVLGCGALGSWAAEMVTRAGAASLDLVDNGIVKPGLLARQNFATDDIGAKKATALAARLRSLVPASVAIRAFDQDAHAFATGDIARFTDYDVVLDCTASHVTQMKLERDWPLFAGRTPPVVSMVTDAKAKHGLCVVLPRDSTSGPWDAYVRLKYRLCADGNRPNIQAAFYERDSMKDLFQPEPGCSDPTFSGSTADATLIAAGALNLACTHGLAQGKRAAMAFGDQSGEQSTAQALPADEMDEVSAGSYRVRIAKSVARKARDWVRKNNRLRPSDYETGGLLWGVWDDATGVIWVFDASGPPPDSRHSRGHFLCGVKGTADDHATRFAQSRGTSGFIGFWHTHPDMPSMQSDTDIAGMATLVSAIGGNQRRALMLIYGRAGARPTAGLYIYESQSVTNSVELVTVGTAQIELKAGVV